jgi:hypothetical protein
LKRISVVHTPRLSHALAVALFREALKAGWFDEAR